MAKCFRVVGQGIPVRMSDEDAFQIVDRDGDGEYCPKSVIRARRATDYCIVEGENCLRKLSPGGGIVKTASLQRHDQHRRVKHAVQERRV